MKNIRKATFLTLMFSLVFFLNFKIPVENIYFINSNTEALAGVEDNLGFCFDVGSIDCPVSAEKVKYVR